MYRIVQNFDEWASGKFWQKNFDKFHNVKRPHLLMASVAGEMDGAKTAQALITITPCAKMWSGYARLHWNYVTLHASQAPALISGSWSIHHSFSLDENTSATTSLATLIFLKSDMIMITWMDEWSQTEHHETRHESGRRCETMQNPCWCNTVASVE